MAFEFEERARNASHPGFIQLPLNVIAVGALAVALTCLATLVVVASIHDVDTLSTVALALAVIAFVAQLIVFVVQTNASNSQMLNSRALHAELLRLLGRMDERARGTDAAVTTINERLLEAALGKVMPFSDDPGVEGLEIKRLARDVAEVLDSSAHDRATRVPRTEREADENRYNDEAIVRMLRTFPGPAESEAAVKGLEALEPTSRELLKRFAEDEIETRGPNSTMGPGLGHHWPGSDGLLRAGLIERDPEGFSLNVLTPKGRDTARLLTALGPWPGEITNELHRFRKSDDGEGEV